MFANNIGIHKAGKYNFYTVETNGKKYVIGGVPERYASIYLRETDDADALILLTSNPQYCGGVEETVRRNPKTEVWATPAGLRNIKEIINSDVNERIIKDLFETDGFKFVVTPGLPWVDTVSVIYEKTLFSGDLLSKDADYRGGFENSGIKINREFALSAIERLEDYEICAILTAKGSPTENVGFAFEEWRRMCFRAKSGMRRAAIVYSSRYGYTELLAKRMKDALCGEFDVYFETAENADFDEVNNSDVLLIGTNTVDRNAPRSVWNVITNLDLINKRGMPYFVFGSFGWAGDGIKLIDKTLSAMGMKRIAKPTEVLFKPKNEDFDDIAKIADKIKLEIL